MRSVHRIVSLFVVLFTLYLGVTGTVIQGVDLRSILRHAPATDPDMMAMREDADGPGVYAVLAPQDFTAQALPPRTDFQLLLGRLLATARSQLGADAMLDFAELRMDGSSPVGRVQAGPRLLTLDFATDHTSIGPVPRRDDHPASLRNQVKSLHRMTTFRRDWLLFINPIVGIAMGVFVVTGVWMYVRLLNARRRARRHEWFWSAGGWWRTLHRWVSVVMAAFLLVVALSGTWLAYESLVFGYYLTAHLPAPGRPMAQPKSPLTPLADAQLPGMLRTSVDAWRNRFGDEPLKVVQLRIYGGMPQGALVFGPGDDTRQVVFNADTGREVSETEPGYPETGFPFGWQAHQYAKQIHRGFFLGLAGRWMGLFSGVSVIFLSVSGAWMYYEMWWQRRRTGRRGLIWA